MEIKNEIGTNGRRNDQSFCGYAFCPRNMLSDLFWAAKVQIKSKILLQFPPNICVRIEILGKVSLVGFDLIANK